jgi:dephospho-CoA kinase
MSSPCTVGLTGGLASGKTAVAARLVARGVPVCDADAVVHDLYRPGAAGTRVVGDLFGAAVLAADGSVDRRVLGDLVLDDAEGLQRLNLAVHPLVRDEIARWLSGLEAAIAVVEAALLVETGAASGYDLLVVVACEPRQQIERALARGMDRQRIMATLAAQAPLADKAAAADVVIDNSGAVEDLESEVDRAWRRVARLCRERRRR